VSIPCAQSPEEVLDRLQMLEDDKLGTFDQLLQTQEEVSSLQAKVQDAYTRVESVRSQLNTQHMQSTVRLQRRNDDLMEVGVNEITTTLFSVLAPALHAHALPFFPFTLHDLSPSGVGECRAAQPAPARASGAAGQPPDCRARPVGPVSGVA